MRLNFFGSNLAESAITDQRKDDPVWIRQFGAERGRRAEAHCCVAARRQT